MKPKKYAFSFLILFFFAMTSLSAVLIQDAEPSFDQPISQMATENQFHSPVYTFWCEEIKQQPSFHRKQWEFCYILQVLHTHDFLKPGKKGLGFGVGEEPLPSLFAHYGCTILATDLDLDSAKKKGWVETNQHAQDLEGLNQSGLCNPEEFAKLVKFRSVDMNHIEPDLEEFDFVWSSCALEHLGSLRAGMDFMKNSLKCLKRGGIAVHTTEFNLSSDSATIATGSTVLYRKKDILQLLQELEEMGYTVFPVNFHPGNGSLDQYVDIPPYKADPHIKLKISEFTCSSIGIIILKR